MSEEKQAEQGNSPSVDEQIESMEQSKRLLSQIDTLLGEGMYPGSLCEKVRQSRAYVSFLKAQAVSALESYKQARHEAAKVESVEEVKS